MLEFFSTNTKFGLEIPILEKFESEFEMRASFVRKLQLCVWKLQFSFLTHSVTAQFTH